VASRQLHRAVTRRLECVALLTREWRSS
jgi:hypothetical protein